ncbi:MAG TPA: winged helix DNA-binding domain-containing protein [Acetobacteraceae bacterium]|nr:winged helix DNA-binding domain-containing protein [Acetobacteraceae bacterium]
MLQRRLTAQLLAGAPARSAPAVAERLLAIQGQDPRGARLAIRARSTGVDAADIDRELTDRRSLVITTLNRGTLHLVRAEDYPLLQSLTTPPLMTANATRLAQTGVDPDTAARAIDLIDRSIANDGPLTRAALRQRLERAGIPNLEQSMVHLIFGAAIRGRIVRGPMVGRQHAFSRVADWLPSFSPPPRDAALAELARRYLAGHGPAGDGDLARWAGLPLRDARAGLAAIAGELRRLPGGLLDLARRGGAGRLPPPRLLGAFEPLLLGWRSRRDVLGDNEGKVVGGGVFRGFALVEGRGAAVWRLTGDRGVEIEPFSELDAGDAAALEDDGHKVRRFLGLPA